MDLVYISKTSVLCSGGGAERRDDEITVRLAQRGHDVVLLSAKTDPDLPKTTTDNGRTLVHVKCIPDSLFISETIGFFGPRYLFPLLSIAPLIRILSRREVGLVVEHMTPYPTFAVVVAKAFGIPIVAMQNEFFDRSAYDIYDPVTASVLLVVQNFLRAFDYDRLVVPTSHVKDRLSAYGINASRIAVIPNAVTDPDLYADDTTDSESDTIVTVSRLTKRKRHQTLFRALAELQDDYPDIKLNILGEGPYRTALVGLTKSLSVQNSVTFHGYVSEDEKRSMLNRAEVFAFASEQEGFGVVMLEAMAAGLPVVARRLPVYEEFFQYGRNGYLVDEDNPEAFAECIASLLDDAAEREYIRDNNLRDSKEYSWERITSRIEDVFWEVSRESR